MKNILIPAAGRSSRFPGMKPKWLLAHPDGDLMVTKSILGLDYHNVDKIYLIILREHLIKYCNNNLDIIKLSFKSCDIDEKLEVVVLEENTTSQPQTIQKAIEQKKIKGSIFIKDVDSFFEAKLNFDNTILTFDLNNMDLVHAKNKSYVQIDDDNLVVNIIEKQVISSKFCVGGYSFNSAKTFLKYYAMFDDQEEFYISHIIFKMILDDIPFRINEVTKYLDWGTIKEWNNFKSNYATMFIGLDGIIVNKNLTYFDNIYMSKPIKKNIIKINEMYETGKVKIIITTSRKSCYSKETENQLKVLGVKYHKILYNLFDAKRIIISDYNNSKPYKSCESINIKTNSEDLSLMLDDCMRKYET